MDWTTREGVLGAGWQYERQTVRAQRVHREDERGGKQKKNESENEREGKKRGRRRDNA